MKIIVFAFSLLIFKGTTSYSQSFLQAYEKYRLNKITNVQDRSLEKNLNRYHKSHTVELDTIFLTHKKRTGFDFNTADSLFLVYEAPLEALFFNDIIIWSGKDTISYSQGFEVIKPGQNRRTIRYQPTSHWSDIRRDSILKLVSKKDFNTIMNLGDNQIIGDGAINKIYVAYKKNGIYRIKACRPKQFAIFPNHHGK